jgi:CspA family cold shock protein
MKQVFRERGEVKFFDDAKGFGFISRPEGPDLFVYCKEIKQDNGARRTLAAGQQVEFEVGRNQRGPCAMNVAKLG